MEKNNWDNLINRFKAYLKFERAFSENTIDSYFHDICLLKDFALEQEPAIDPFHISLTHLQDFLGGLNSSQIHSNSQSRIISGIRAFYKFLLLENLIDNNPTELLEMPKPLRKMPEVLSNSDIEKMISVIDRSTHEGARSMAIIETLYGSGLRVSELVNLQLSNIFFDEEFLLVTGKGDKQRFVPINTEALAMIRLYVENVRNKLAIKKGNEGFVFLNQRGSKLSRISVFTMVQQLAERAGIKKDISPHTFRHSFATELVQNGADLRVVQEMLGHASITTTEIYTHLNTKFLQETIQKYHPFYQKQNKKPQE